MTTATTTAQTSADAIKQPARGRRRAIRAKAILPGRMWPLSSLHRRCGYGDRARAAMIEAGLPVYRYHKRAWIFTDELIDFLRRHREPPETTKKPGSGGA
jgi:hypothetical protein